MTKHPIRELVNEVFIDAGNSDASIKTVYKSKVLTSDEDVSFEEFFEGERLNLLKGLWKDSFAGDTYSNYARMYDKMSITKHISVHPRDIGKDKTFYFIGKRYTKVKDVKRIADHYEWKWETKDPNLADFIILGDAPSWSEAKINEKLNLPVVMDDSLRTDLHFLFNPEVKNNSINDSTVASFLNSGNFDHFKLVISMIQYLKEDVLSSDNKFRLIRSYVTAFKANEVTFDLRNKEHVWISDTVQRYCHDFHRSLVTNSYLNNRFTSGWFMHTSSPNKVRPRTYYNNKKISVVWNIKREFNFVHKCEGEETVLKHDLDEGNRYSTIPKIKYTSYSNYCNISNYTIKANELYYVVINLSGFNNTIIYFTLSDDSFNILCYGVTNSIYNSNTNINDAKNMWSQVDENLWEANYDSRIKPIFEKIIESITLDEVGNSIVKNLDYRSHVLEYDELLLDLKVYTSPENKYEHKLKFLRRKEALENL